MVLLIYSGKQDRLFLETPALSRTYALQSVSCPSLSLAPTLITKGQRGTGKVHVPWAHKRGLHMWRPVELYTHKNDLNFNDPVSRPPSLFASWHVRTCTCVANDPPWKAGRPPVSCLPVAGTGGPRVSHMLASISDKWPSSHQVRINSGNV